MSNRPIQLWILLAGALLLTAGCFREQSFPAQPGDIVLVNHEAAAEPLTCRKWLRATHEALEPHLPRACAPALLTEDLAGDGEAVVDVMAHFGHDERHLQTLLCNFYGLSYSAQCIGVSLGPEKLQEPWPGFEEVCIPVTETVETFGWLGLARNGEKILETDCIVILPGLLGNNGVKRMHDLARALVKSGYHVLAYEVRGHGLSDMRRPDVYYTFGILETADLMVVSDWLEEKPFVRRTGMIGYCWGANLALLAAWYENLPPAHPSISEKLAEQLPAISKRRRYRAGVMAFSPTLAFEDIIEKLRTPRYTLIDPAHTSLQDTVRNRMRAKGHPEISGDLGRLIEFEFARTELNYPGAVEDGIRFLQLLPQEGKPAGDKMAHVRTPVLLVYGANDPLAPSREVAEFVHGVDNPNFAAIVLPDGGHIGFAAYARSYYFSLIMNFFDPNSGAAAMSAAGQGAKSVSGDSADTNAS